MADVKRIALFLDGTWNAVDDNTNVWRLKSLCAQTPEQLVYYSAGVGTQKGEKISGGMFGIGINDEVTNAYEWLLEHYEDGAQIFIFGFSRGAFTARSLAGFIAKCGLLKPGSPVSLTQLFDRYRQGNVPRTVRELQEAPADGLAREDLWIREYARAIPVWFQGVWDTVGSLGVPVPFAPKVSTEDFAFLETDMRINYTHGYHALAMDEHREAFAPTLWVKSTPKGEAPPVIAPGTIDFRDMNHVEQRWFAGAHSNVGGGYENDLLAQIPLEWLMSKAIAHGLVFTNSVVIDGDENTCPIHDSLKEMAHGVYALLTKPYYRPVGAERVENGDAVTTIFNETIDGTVFDRWQKCSDYRPPNLIDWAKRRGVDPGAITGAVMAKDAAPVVYPAQPASATSGAAAGGASLS